MFLSIIFIFVWFIFKLFLTKIDKWNKVLKKYTTCGKTYGISFALIHENKLFILFYFGGINSMVLNLIID